MNYIEKTNEYYSKWIGQDNVLNSGFNGVMFVYSAERNNAQDGYSRPFDLYIFSQDDKLIISYGDRLVDRLEEIKDKFISVMPIGKVVQIVKELFGSRFEHDIKYVFNEVPDMSLNSRALDDDDYIQFLNFFEKCYPECDDTSWLYDYFIDIVSAHLCYGLFVDGVLVSCTDAPDVPYLKDTIKEIGINTLTEYRGHGYATDVCVACAKHIVQNGNCPLWYTDINNIASQKLAEKVGFIKFADVIAVSL